MNATTKTKSSVWKDLLSVAAFAALLGVCLAGPAQADRYYDHGQWHDHGYYRGHDHWRGYRPPPRPGYVYAPPVVYAPPPPMGLNLIVPLHFN